MELYAQSKLAKGFYRAKTRIQIKSEIDMWSHLSSISMAASFCIKTWEEYMSMAGDFLITAFHDQIQKEFIAYIGPINGSDVILRSLIPEFVFLVYIDIGIA